MEAIGWDEPSDEYRWRLDWKMHKPLYASKFPTLLKFQPDPARRQYARAGRVFRGPTTTTTTTRTKQMYLHTNWNFRFPSACTLTFQPTIRVDRISCDRCACVYYLRMPVTIHQPNCGIVKQLTISRGGGEWGGCVCVVCNAVGSACRRHGHGRL